MAMPAAVLTWFAYHNYGFRVASRPTRHGPACLVDMCFRGVEDAWSVLQTVRGEQAHLDHRDRLDCATYAAGGCGSAPWAPIFAGFAMSDQAQADNLVGAFQYARANGPGWAGSLSSTWTSPPRARQIRATTSRAGSPCRGTPPRRPRGDEETALTPSPKPSPLRPAYRVKQRIVFPE